MANDDSARAAFEKQSHVTRMAVNLMRSLQRLHLAVKGCARIGFQESSPTTNANHASIWNDLNDAQRDAEIKLKGWHLFCKSEPDGSSETEDQTILHWLEEACKAQCERCARGFEIYGIHSGWAHKLPDQQFKTCEASGVRALMEKIKQEKK